MLYGPVGMRTAAHLAVETILFVFWCIIVLALRGATDAWRARVGIGEGWSTAAFFLLMVGGSVVTSRLSSQVLKLFDMDEQKKAE